LLLITKKNERSCTPRHILSPHDGKTIEEIFVRGPYVTPAYYKDPEKPLVMEKTRLFHTGDVVAINEEGYITMVDEKWAKFPAPKYGRW